jgi:hypothetical protein
MHCETPVGGYILIVDSDTMMDGARLCQFHLLFEARRAPNTHYFTVVG